LNLSKGIRRVIDLSHSIHPKMMVFDAPWHKAVEFESLGQMDTVGRRTTHLHMGTHIGTHIDAPSHFIGEGMPISEIDLDRFIGPATCLDLSNIKPNNEVGLDDVKRALGDDAPNERIILYFNWARNFGLKNFYIDQPYLGSAAAEWILQFNPKLLGYDIAMPDNPLNGRNSECDSPMHKTFLGEGIPLLESMNMTEYLAKTFTLIALPLNLKDLDGSPVRCVAVE
jgi:arylformamidase